MSILKSFKYVGPEEIRIRSGHAPGGTPITSKSALLEWFKRSDTDMNAEDGWATYVVNLEGTLLVAPRRTEHVACAQGAQVQAAGEIQFDEQGNVIEVTNHSTGYCPAEDCWDPVRSALDKADLDRPDEFTILVLFRRCTHCGQRNLIKDDWYRCEVCDAELPGEWNFALDTV